MTQLTVRIPGSMLAAIDELVAEGRFASRSGVVRAGLEAVVRQAERDRIDEAFVEGFRRFPDEERDLADARRLAIGSIEPEPWERWW